jgi:hypothetical protein
VFGFRESVPALRFITGALFGSAVVWFAYPRVAEAMVQAERAARSTR